MTLTLAQLPKAVRDRLSSDLPPARKRARQVALGGPRSWVCEAAGCPETFTAWAQAERHAHAAGHVRISLGGLSGIVDVGSYDLGPDA